MKKFLLIVATTLMLTVSVPSFADGNPSPHQPIGRCPTTGCTA